MFRSTLFYDNLTNFLVGPWKLYAAIGASLVLAALLIFIFPELLAYLIALFLLINGVLFLAVAWRLKQLRKEYQHWVETYWEP